jgi:hypothetical protein
MIWAELSWCYNQEESYCLSLCLIFFFIPPIRSISFLGAFLFIFDRERLWALSTRSQDRKTNRWSKSLAEAGDGGTWRQMEESPLLLCHCHIPTSIPKEENIVLQGTMSPHKSHEFFYTAPLSGSSSSTLEKLRMPQHLTIVQGNTGHARSLAVHMPNGHSYQLSCQCSHLCAENSSTIKQK